MVWSLWATSLLQTSYSFEIRNRSTAEFSRLLEQKRQDEAKAEKLEAKRKAAAAAKALEERESPAAAVAKKETEAAASAVTTAAAAVSAPAAASGAAANAKANGGGGSVQEVSAGAGGEAKKSEVAAEEEKDAMGLAEGTGGAVADGSVFAMMSLLKARGDLTAEEDYVGRAKDSKPQVLKSNLKQQAAAVLGKHPSRGARRGGGRSGRHGDRECV